MNITLKKTNTIRRILAILLAAWMMIISNGILINQHYSHGKLYSSSIYWPAEKCCLDIESNIEKNSDTCDCLNNLESTASCTINENHQHTGSCCTESSDWIQLEETYSSSEPSAFPEIFFLILFSFFSLSLESESTNVDYSLGEPPPNHSPPIFIANSSLLC